MMNYILLAIIILIGLITSYEDWRIGKIRNLWLGFGFIFGLIVWAGSFVFLANMGWEYLLKLGLNFFCASLVGFFMWKLRAWSAGDAKMLMLYAFLTPLSFYSNSYLAVFPAFVIVFNTFLILLFYLLIRSSFFGIKLTWQKELKFDWLEKKDKAQNYLRGLARFLPSFLFFMITVSWSYKYVQDFIGLNFLLYQIVAVTLVIIFKDFLFRFFSQPKINMLTFFAFLLLFFIGLVLDYDFIFSAMSNVFLMIFVFMLLFPLLNKVINFHLDQADKKEININDLEEGMMISHNSIAVLELDGDLGQGFGVRYQELEFIKNRAKEKKQETIHINKPFYFAIWLFVGVITTLLAKGSILSWMLNFS